MKIYIIIYIYILYLYNIILNKGYTTAEIEKYKFQNE